MAPPPKYVSCPSCRALLEPGTRVCPYCQRPLARSRPVPLGGFESVSRTGLSRPLLGVVVVVFAAMLAVDALAGRPGSRGWLGFPSPSFETLGQFGALRPRAVLEAGHVWLLVSPIFLHANLLHLFFNVWSLYVLGPVVEEAFGPRRFLTLFLATGILGNVASVAVGWGGVGASGSLFGLMGATLVFARRRRSAIGPALVSRWITQWLVFAFLVTVPLWGVVNHAAHAGGLVSGLGAGWLADRYGARAARFWRRTDVAVVVLSLAALAATGLDAVRGAREARFATFDAAMADAWNAALREGSGAEPPPALRIPDLDEASAALEAVAAPDPTSDSLRRDMIEALRRLAASRGPEEARAALALAGEVRRRHDEARRGR